MQLESRDKREGPIRIRILKNVEKEINNIKTQRNNYYLHKQTF